MLFGLIKKRDRSGSVTQETIPSAGKARNNSSVSSSKSKRISVIGYNGSSIFGDPQSDPERRTTAEASYITIVPNTPQKGDKTQRQLNLSPRPLIQIVNPPEKRTNSVYQRPIDCLPEPIVHTYPQTSERRANDRAGFDRLTVSTGRKKRHSRAAYVEAKDAAGKDYVVQQENSTKTYPSSRKHRNSTQIGQKLDHDETIHRRRSRGERRPRTRSYNTGLPPRTPSPSQGRCEEEAFSPITPDSAGPITPNIQEIHWRASRSKPSGSEYPARVPFYCDEKEVYLAEPKFYNEEWHSPEDFYHPSFLPIRKAAGEDAKYDWIRSRTVQPPSDDSRSNFLDVNDSMKASSHIPAISIRHTPRIPDNPPATSPWSTREGDLFFMPDSKKEVLIEDDTAMAFPSPPGLNRPKSYERLRPQSQHRRILSEHTTPRATTTEFRYETYELDSNSRSTVLQQPSSTRSRYSYTPKQDLRANRRSYNTARFLESDNERHEKLRKVLGI